MSIYDPTEPTVPSADHDAEAATKLHKLRKKPRPHQRPRQSEAMKKRWADPAYRAKHDRHFAARRADETKAWSRRGIPNGFTRETTEVAWQEAREKAQTMLEVLRVNGLL